MLVLYNSWHIHFYIQQSLNIVMLKVVSFINVYSNLVLVLDDPMIDEQIEKREDVHPIRLEHDTNVPKSVII